MKKVTLGIIILFVGVFLLFHNLGYFPWSIYHIVISWQALLIGIGVVLLFDEKSNNKSAGILLAAIGTLFLLPRIFDVDASGFFLPLVIIVIGILFIVKASTKKPHRFKTFGDYISFENKSGDSDGTPDAETGANNNGYISKEYVFTGSKEKWTFNNVKGIEINSVFSSVELDFTQLELSRNVEKVQIKISSVLGNVVLYVPDDWNIITQKTSVFGSFADNRTRNVVQSANNGKPVYLELDAIFGGGEIKCYE
ncbi:MAG: cell wall-active antibiotics response protein [Dysgonamonadaceae bacterium]|jgi:predicted membrane protein|nr:cell wall-active antibiotics response protein [Dysgonamonadaceae bacterium]